VFLKDGVEKKGITKNRVRTESFWNFEKEKKNFKNFL